MRNSKKLQKIKEIVNSVRWQEVKEEAVELLRKLIRIDTTNPPGNEKEAAELLSKYFSEYGIESQIVESEPQRSSVIANLEGKKDLKPIILLSHLDVVPANPSEWRFPPFSGEVKDGYIWGRGAIDCKGLAVVEAVAMTLIKRSGIKPDRGIKFISVADEEMGGEKGAKYVVENLDIDGFGVLNEGGTGVVLGNRKIYMPCFGEKGPLWLKIKAKGKPGHASMPHKDNPNLILVQALYKILKSDLGKKLSDGFISSAKFYLLDNKKSLSGLKLLLSLIEKSDFAKEILGKALSSLFYMLNKNKLSAMFSNTLSVTIMKSGYKENVIPEEAEAILDIRILPGYDHDEIIERMRKIVDDPRVSFEIISVYEPSQSNPVSDFMILLKEATSAVFETAFFPILATGFTDSRFFRKKGIPAYGFLPFFLTDEDLSTMHGIDERISMENIELGLKLMLAIILHICTEENSLLGL